MKHQSALVASLFCLSAIFSLNASAASDTPADASASHEQSMKKMKPHSHMEEKTGMTSTKADDKTGDETAADEPKAKKTSPAKDKSKHFHPRDGK